MKTDENAAKAKSKDATPVAVLTEVLGQEGMAALRAYIGRELHLHANGASEAEREAMHL